MVVTGVGKIIARAQQSAIALADKSNVSDRKDIGNRLIARYFHCGKTWIPRCGAIDKTGPWRCSWRAPRL